MARVTIIILKVLADKAKVSKLIYCAQKMIVGHMTLKAKAVKQTILTHPALADQTQISVPTTQYEAETANPFKHRAFQHYHRGCRHFHIGECPGRVRT